MASIIGSAMLLTGAAERIVRSLLTFTGQPRASLSFLASGFQLGSPCGSAEATSTFRSRLPWREAARLVIHKYQTRIRLRAAISGLSDRNIKVEVVSRAIGSVKNFYKALWTHTGLLRSDCRNLSDRAAEELLSSRLSRRL